MITFILTSKEQVNPQIIILCFFIWRFFFLYKVKMLGYGQASSSLWVLFKNILQIFLKRKLA